MLFSLRTLRRYASRNRIRSTVPTPTVATNKSAHTPVITNPTGNIPNVLPGSTKPCFCEAAEGDVDDDPFACLSANTPFTKDAAVEDTLVLTVLSSLAVPERVIVGMRRARADVL